jgi:hypothetical protein
MKEVVSCSWRCSSLKNEDIWPITVVESGYKGFSYCECKFFSLDCHVPTY